MLTIERPADAAEPGPAAGTPRPHRHWYRRPRWIALLVVVALLIGVGIPFSIAWSHRGAKQASMSDAIKAFRKTQGATGSGLLTPATGVYTFKGSGKEKLSLLSTSQGWGPDIPATITRDKNGCWTFRVDLSTHHWQSAHYCPKGRTLQQVGDETFQSFDFVAITESDHNVTTCSPPMDRVRIDAKPGDHWAGSCAGESRSRGTKFTATGTDTFVGIENVRVGKVKVPAYRYRVERTITGSQDGTERYDFWYSVADGMPVRTVRAVDIHSPSPIGTVAYRERGHYTLASLTPKT